jgi:hypothetical protein
MSSCATWTLVLTERRPRGLLPCLRLDVREDDAVTDRHGTDVADLDLLHKEARLLRARRQ